MKKINIFIILTLCVFYLVGCGKSNVTINGSSVEINKVDVCDYSDIDLSLNDENLDNKEYVMQYLLDNTKYEDYSKEEVTSYIESSKAYYAEYASLMGVDYETYITTYTEYSVEEFEKEIEKSGIAYVKEKDILLNIANNEGIDFTDEDYDNFLNELIGDTGYNSLEDFKNMIIAEGQEADMKEAAYLDKIVTYVVNLNTN